MDDRLQVVVDTNVLISGALFPNSVPAAVLDYASASAELLVGTALLAEYCDRLLGPKFDRLVPRAQRLLFLNHFIATARRIDNPPAVRICRDPKDDMVLAVALGGRADVVVSGDKDLLSLGPFRGVAIVTPRDFLEMVRSRDR